jgi:hypothetical protein
LNHGQISEHGISKHHLIFLSYNLKVPKRKAKLITFRNFKGINNKSSAADAAMLPWNDVELFDDIDSKVEHINSL